VKKNGTGEKMAKKMSAAVSAVSTKVTVQTPHHQKQPLKKQASKL